MDFNQLIQMPLRQVDRVNQYIDACICARGSKEMQAIKAELDAKDKAIEKLEDEIRRKDSEKDNLMAMQRDLQQQIQQIRSALEAQASESEERLKAATMMQARARGLQTRKSLRGDMGRDALTGEPMGGQGFEGGQGFDVGGSPPASFRSGGKPHHHDSAAKMQARFRGKKDREAVDAKRSEMGVASGAPLDLPPSNPMAPPPQPLSMAGQMPSATPPPRAPASGAGALTGSGLETTASSPSHHGHHHHHHADGGDGGDGGGFFDDEAPAL